MVVYLFSEGLLCVSHYRFNLMMKFGAIRMHSSGMCTACLLTVSQHALGSGWCVSQHPLDRGCVYPSMHWAAGGVYPSIHWTGGVCIPACTAGGGGDCPGGVCPGGCLPRGWCLPRGVSAQGYTPCVATLPMALWTEWQTRVIILPFLKLRLRAVNIIPLILKNVKTKIKMYTFHFESHIHRLFFY